MKRNRFTSFFSSASWNEDDFIQLNCEWIVPQELADVLQLGKLYRHSWTVWWRRRNEFVSLIMLWYARNHLNTSISNSFSVFFYYLSISRLICGYFLDQCTGETSPRESKIYVHEWKGEREKNSLMRWTIKYGSETREKKVTQKWSRNSAIGSKWKKTKDMIMQRRKVFL